MKALHRSLTSLPLWACTLLALTACTQRDIVVVQVDRVDLSPAEASVLVGGQTQLTATVRASRGEPLTGRIVTWSSDDPDIATADANGRVSGVGVGTATIRATSDGASATARVTVTAGPVPRIGATPGTVTFTAIQNGATPGDRTVSITNVGTGQLHSLTATVRYPTGPAGWLAAVLGGTTAPTTLVLSANHAGLAPGTYRAVVDVAAPDASNSPAPVEVELTVTGPQPAIGLGATSVSFAAPAGGGNPAKQSVAVTNAGGGTLSGLTAAVSYTAGQPTGWLAAVLGSTAAPTTLELTASTGSLAVGVYTATVRVSSPVAQNSPQDVQVTFTVGSPPPAIGVSPASLTFTAVTGTTAGTQQVAITNLGTGTLSGLGVAVTYPGGQPSGWVTTSLAGTTAPATLTVGASAVGLPAGTYTATISITSPVASNSPQTVGVTLQVSAQAAPGVPTNLTATAVSSTRIDLAWGAPATGGPVIGYRVERRVGTGAFALRDSVGAGTLALHDDDLQPGTTYGYRVQACNASGCSAFTAVASATTPVVGGVPGPPTNITFTAVTSSTLTVNWSAPVTGGTPDRYYVERRGPTGPRTIISGNLSAGTFSFADSGLSPDTTYRYRVTACNAAGCTVSLDEPSVKTAPGG